MISIIVPVFNCEGYIDKCIGSIINQDEKDIELIIVNDGSDDGTSDICNKWKEKDQRILLVEQENQGQGSARNAGIKKASGEYLVFVDADDYLEPEALSVLSASVKFNSYDILMYDYYYVNSDSGERYECKHNVTGSVKSDILIDSTTYLWDKMFRRAFFMEHVILEDSYGEDLSACAFLIASTDRIGSLEECLYNHIGRTGSLTSDYSKVMEIVDSLRSMVDLFKKQDIFQKYYYELLYLSCKQYNLYRIELKNQFDANQYQLLMNKFFKYFKTVYYLDSNFIKWLELENRRRYIVIGNDLLPEFKKWRSGGIWKKFRNIEKYMIDPYIVQRENEIEPLMTEYIISFSNELDAVKYETLNHDLWFERWENQCIKFIETLKESSFTGNIVVMKQHFDNEKVDVLVDRCCNYLSKSNSVIIAEDIKTRVDFLAFVAKYKPSSDEFTGIEKAHASSQETIYLRGEYFRAGLNLNIMNMLLKIRNSKRKLAEYFQSKSIESIAVYGLGYLGERLVEELIQEGFNIKYGIDRNMNNSSLIQLVGPDEDFDHVDAIIVTPVHLFDEIKELIEMKFSGIIISLDEIMEYYIS